MRRDEEIMETEARRQAAESSIKPSSEGSAMKDFEEYRLRRDEEMMEALRDAAATRRAEEAEAT